MAELDYLLDELETTAGVIDSTLDETTGVLTFRSHVGEHSCLTSEMLTVIGRYDCQLYPFENGKYKAIPP